MEPVIEPCQLCNLEIIEPSMTLLCNHHVHTRCYLMNNMYRCIVCNELIITDDLRDELENRYRGDNSSVKKNKVNFNNLYKLNKIFKTKIKNYRILHTKLKKQFRQLKIDTVTADNSLNLYYKLYQDETKRLKKYISTHNAFKTYKTTFTKFYKLKQSVELDYDVNLTLYNPKLDRENAKEYGKNIFVRVWKYKPHNILHKFIRKIRNGNKK